MIKRIINFLYFLDSANGYLAFKTFTKNILDNNHYEYKKYFDFFMIFLVLSTIGILIYEVNHPKIVLLNTWEYFAITVFIIEWLGRVWIYSDVRKTVIADYEESLFLAREYRFGHSVQKVIKEKFDFILSPLSIIDLLAILPYYRPLRVLRIFLLFRLFKILRYTNSLKEFISIFAERKFELYTLALLSSAVIFFGSTIMFVYEGPIGANDKVNSYFDAVYWALITISTVGYGDIVPITPEGKFVTLILIMNGFLVIAVSTSIVTTGLSERMESIKQNRVENEVKKLDSYIIICGYNAMSINLIHELQRVRQKFLVIDNNEDKIKKAKEKNLLALKGDATNMDFLESIVLKKKARTIIALTEDDATNFSIVLGSRTLNSDITIITLVNTSEVENKLKLAGADFILNPNQINAFVASEYIGQPVAFEAIDGILLNEDISAEVDEMEIISGMNIVGKSINSIEFEEYNLTLIGVINSANNNEFVFNPTNHEYMINEKDIFILIGYKQSLADLKKDFLK